MEPTNLNDACLIALDWGTSSLRAYLLDRRGSVLSMRASDDGVAAIAARGAAQAAGAAADTADGAFRACFERLCGDWLALDPALSVIASGMVGSRQGWREAAYLDCPADLHRLGKRLLRIDDLAGRVFAIVPGLMQATPADLADVMRGEETQLLGLLSSGPNAAGGMPRDDRPAGGTPADDMLCVLPGTHSKWVRVRGGSVQSFATFMTGELYAAIASHTIVGRLLPATGDRFDPATFRAAVNQGADQAGQLTALLFSIRAQALLGTMPVERLSSRLSGLLIGAELAGARERFGGFDEVRLLGAPLLSDRYRVALAERGCAARLHDADIVVRGLHGIAVQAGLIRVS